MAGTLLGVGAMGANGGETPLARARALAGLRRWEAAAEAARAAVADDPLDAAALGLLSQCLLNNGHPGESWQAAQAALCVDPTNSNAFFFQAEALRKLGRPMDAWQVANTWIKVRPAEAYAYAAVANAALDVRRPSEGLVAAQRAAGLRPQDQHVLLTLSRAQIAVLDFGAAEATARRALAVDPSSAGAMNNLGVALERQRHRLAAYRCYRAAVRLDPTNKTAQGNIWKSLRWVRSLALVALCLGGLYVVLGVLLAVVAPFEYPQGAPWWVHGALAVVEAAAVFGLLKGIGRLYRRVDPVLRGVLSTRIGGGVRRFIGAFVWWRRVPD